MEQASEPEFEADVQIGKGLRYIDRDGRALIAAGRLTLRTRTGDIIAEAAIGDVRADKARFSGGAAAQVWIGEESYKIEPLRIHRIHGESLAGTATSLGGGLKRLTKSKEFTQQFLDAVAAAGGRIGN
jgi:hypothetical protein